MQTNFKIYCTWYPGSKCLEICNPDTGTPNVTDHGDICDSPKIDPATGCFIPCIEDPADGRRVYANDAKTVTDLIGSSNYLYYYKQFCERRNPALAHCPDGNIVPRSDALGCGCGVCEMDKCLEEISFVYYYDGTSRTKKCKKITCEWKEVIYTASYDGTQLALVGLTTDIEYVNYIRDIDEEEVDIRYCTTVTPTDEDTPSPTVHVAST